MGDLLFSDTSSNGSGSAKIFSYSGTMLEMAGDTPPRMRTSPNNVFLVDSADGRYIVETGVDGLISSYYSSET